LQRRKGQTKSTTVLRSSINVTEQRRAVRATLDAIPSLQHRMIELAFFSGMTSLEIAKELRQSPDAVECGIQYAMLQLFGLFKSIDFSLQPPPRNP
jgi:DNA-directed RNA polymerase specialized sigma24 family protein